MKRVATAILALCCSLAIQAQDRQQILKVYNWGDYIGVGVIEKFEKWYQQVTGQPIKVSYVTYDYPEECFDMIKDQQTEVDVFCPPEYLAERMMNTRCSPQSTPVSWLKAFLTTCMAPHPSSTTCYSTSARHRASPPRITP